MSDDHDPVILRLFAAQDENLPSGEFMLKLGKRIDRQRRVRRVSRLIAIVACPVLAALSAPWVAQLTSTLIELTAMGIRATGPVLSLPLTWFLVGATALGCSPVVFLWRTGRW